MANVRRVWSGRRDSNPRHTAWKAVTLPTELLPHRIGRPSPEGSEPMTVRADGIALGDLLQDALRAGPTDHPGYGGSLRLRLSMVEIHRARRETAVRSRRRARREARRAFEPGRATPRASVRAGERYARIGATRAACRRWVRIRWQLAQTTSHFAASSRSAVAGRSIAPPDVSRKRLVVPSRWSKSIWCGAKVEPQSAHGHSRNWRRSSRVPCCRARTRSISSERFRS